MAARACEYATPTVPAGRLVVVMVSAGGFTVMENIPDAVTTGYGPVWLVTCTEKVSDAVAVGVPEIRPPEDSWRPGGRDPEANVKA